MRDILRKIFGMFLTTILILLVTIPVIQSDSILFLRNSNEYQYRSEGTIEPLNSNCIVYVDDDFEDDPLNHKWDTIQEGIDDAENSNCNKIFVYCGSYDNGGSWIKIFDFESLELIGEDINCVIIDAEGSGGGFYLNSCRNVYISNFTI
jgi:hypothetical protein